MHEERMDRVVVTQERLVISAVAGAVSCFDEASQRREIRARCTVGNYVHHAALDRFPRLENVEDVIKPNLGHNGSAPWQHGDEPVNRQPGNRLPHWHATHSEIGGERELVDQRAWRQPQVEDSLAEFVIGEVAGTWLPYDHVHLLAYRVIRASAIQPTDTSRVSRWTTRI